MCCDGIGTVHLATVPTSDLIAALRLVAAHQQPISQRSRTTVCWTGNRISFYIWCPRGKSRGARVKQPDCYRVTAASTTSKSDDIYTEMRRLECDMVITCDVFDVCLLCLIFIIIKYLSQEEEVCQSDYCTMCTLYIQKECYTTLSLY